MASLRLPRANPLAFTRWPVTVITVIVYLALLIPLLVVHHVVPSAPSSPPSGLDISEAWADLQVLTNGFHPYNSHQNDVVHSWLLRRINEILDARPSEQEYRAVDEEKPDVFVFDDVHSNLTTYGGTLKDADLGVYFEGTNIIVYIRGSEDDTEHWWEAPNGVPTSKGGVLVNSHYDSVSTGFGATDDGVGVVTCLQLVKYFTTPGHAPRRGLVVLFNNGEEDFLNGARVYSQHPISKLPHTFLNLEGAGAGGRATLFRSSDFEVTGPYMRSPHPFGSVLSANGFDTGLIASQTDYVVFQGNMGLRGLDVAFMEPRARYHTNQDDTRHTSKDSVWHMLSAAVATTEGLVYDSSDRFDGAPNTDGGVPSGSGSQAVWFDLFGSTFVLFQLHTLFALLVTLLIVGPLTLLFTSIALTKADKMYLFRSSAKSEDHFDVVPLQGLRGFFRFPFLFGIPTVVTVGLAYLVTKVNPYIIHSSAYAVWSMMVAAWVFLAWFVSRVADFARPSAFHRIYTLTWMYVLSWASAVIATVYANQKGLAGGYFIFFFHAGIFLATWISYLELFALPSKTEYVDQLRPASGRVSGHGSRRGTASGEDYDGEDVEEEPTESTSLLGSGQRTTFANYVRVGGDNHAGAEEEVNPNVYGREQAWSSALPRWTWILQLLLTVPITLIMVGPLALLTISAISQTGQDGGHPLFVYIAIAIFTTIILTPLLPFIHRYTYHVPLFLLAVFLGTLIYNLVAFPFSDSNRLKLYYVQEVDLDTGVNRATFAGLSPFVRDVSQGLPSASGQDIACDWHTKRRNLLSCSWEGIAPQPVEGDHPMKDWVSFNISKSTDKLQARFEVSGLNTRACRIVFDTPVKSLHVVGSAYDPRFPQNTAGVNEVRLWSRSWENQWTVDVEWDEDALKGNVICLWSDHNRPGVIPALDEAIQFAPVWVAVTKVSDGLVEGRRAFEIGNDA
ncbi:putative zinc metalloprotease [Aspergillus bertholletiae]|uniref:Peptide hydrolase n=1 Tax=Aspergillus bertholletiae TaxID=1226010 RepID=A0A5N7B5C2_9EURO|nr:putative zinc metalloprotease [Aspergillus bertholletiae]